MAGCLGLVLWIDDVDRTELLIHETLVINQTNDGLNSTCTFDLLDQAVIREDVWTVGHTHITDDGHVITGYATFFPQTKVVVSITNVPNTITYFSGILARVHATHLGQIEIMPGFVEPETQVLRCECVDYNQVLEEMVIDDFREYGGIRDDNLITAVFDEFVKDYDDPYDINYAAHVTMVPYVFDLITFDSITVRQFMDTICGITGAVWYVDYGRNLHYAADEAALVPAWHLSDNPDYVNSFVYFDDITKEKDATNLVNRVFVVCATDLLPVSLWFIDQDSIDKYGSHRAIVRDTSLFDIGDIEEKGNAILEKFKDPIVTYVLKTYKGTPGGGATQIIRAGQHIRVVCAFYDLDETFLINALTITFPVDGTPVYEITCGGLDSSASGSATRSTLDQIHVPNITPSSLPIAARGWGHDMTFSAPDYRTVAWEGPLGGDGTIETADGQIFTITPANTGNMAAITYVYLDTNLSRFVLQHSVDAEDAIGLGKIMIATCWPGVAAAGAQPEVLSGFQVFGGGAGTTLILNADNVAANSITANEIYVNSLSAIVANMGLLTAGEIRMIGAAGSLTLDSTGIKLFDGVNPAADNIRLWLNTADGKLTLKTAVAGNPRIEIDNTEMVGYDGLNVKQFYLSAADGVAYAGAGAVRLEAGGLYLDQGAGGGPDQGYLHFETGGSDRGIMHGYHDATGNHLVLYAVSPTLAADQGTIYLEAEDSTGAAGAKVQLKSKMTGTGGNIVFAAEGAIDLVVYKDYVKMLDDLRVGGGLVVGNTTTNPVQGRIYCDGANTDGTKGWELGHHTAAADVPSNGYFNVWLNGALRKVMTRA